METKVCTSCGIEKPIEDFALRNKKTGNRRAECKQCIGKRQKLRYRAQKDALNEYKQQLGCAKCGEKRFYLLDFHHIDPTTKVDTVARLSVHSSAKAAYEEIKK